MIQTNSKNNHRERKNHKKNQRIRRNRKNILRKKKTIQENFYVFKNQETSIVILTRDQKNHKEYAFLVL